MVCGVEIPCKGCLGISSRYYSLPNGDLGFLLSDFTASPLLEHLRLIIFKSSVRLEISNNEDSS